MSREPITSVKGTRDILPEESAAWQRVEQAARTLFDRYGYREIRPPVIEETQLFARSIGAETDIVAKEMYTFDDRDGSSITLRPEATAGIVRAVVEHNLVNTDPALKVWTLGPMFRRERPQKGRYRQFHQVDVEAFGLAHWAMDVEIIDMALAYLRACGITGCELVLNSVGDAQCRPQYVETLREALRPQAARMCTDCQRRAETNPLRVLDCKVPEDQPLIDALPRISDHLCPECRSHFDGVKEGLKLLEIPYRLSHRLVRGLDYYTRTTFEVTSDALGAQNSVLGGGRYDGLVKELGGPDLPAVGFALGLERLVMMLGEQPALPRCDLFLVLAVKQNQPASSAGVEFDRRPTDEALERAMRMQHLLRGRGVRVLMDPGGGSIKSQMKRADRLGARFVAILGEAEMDRGTWTVRDMARSFQEPVAEEEVAAYLEDRLRG
ncbi:MAG TPA: histidine--tRNA ligase [Vicinamibacteria bacterium]|nr:histidine--tRNA ligase [Vicinamibacteria bacterium]